MDWHLRKGSEFFLTKDLPEAEGFKFPPYFHSPVPPHCFQSPYDFNASTQFTTLAFFPPCAQKGKREEKKAQSGSQHSSTRECV